MSADNTSYSVSFKDKPTKPDPEGAKMVRECITILARSLALRKIADAQFQRIMEFHKKYEDKNPDDTPWQGRKKATPKSRLAGGLPFNYSERAMPRTSSMSSNDLPSHK